MAADPRRPLGFELAIVILVSAAVLVPGIWSYSLVDPWETHYGEVARNMVRDHDFVHTRWPATNPQDSASEGFRSKPVLTFWMMSAGLAALNVGDYSGSMVQDARVMVALRLPFVLSAIAGLTLLWWALARLVSRRVAWLALLIIGSSPMFCLIARQAIPDMPHTACVMGAIAMFALAMEDGDRPISTVFRLGSRGVAIKAHHVLGLLIGSFVFVQVGYYAWYLAATALAIRAPIAPAITLPLFMIAMLAALFRDGWLVVRAPLVFLGGVISAIVGDEPPPRAPGQSLWRHLCDDILRTWARHSPDRYVLRLLVWPVAWILGGGWASSDDIAGRALELSPVTTMRQVYLLGCFFVVGISVLAKGPPGAVLVVAVIAFYLVLLGRFRALYEGAFEVKRGLVLVILTFLPWHVAMYLVDGLAFIDEYVFTHILNRAAVGVDSSPGTFEYYTSQLGYGMWLWAALLPVALPHVLLRTGLTTRAGRVRLVIALWAIAGFAEFALVQTKFHHYILPVVPALGVIVALFLDDLLTTRARLHLLYRVVAAAIVLLVCRDLMYEPERWIEMFVFRYDRPWPAAEPWSIDVSDGVLALGLLGAAAVLALSRFVRLGVTMLLVASLGVAIWAQQIYMPIAGTHWGMREAVRTYYEQRTIYGQELVYFSASQLRDDWAGIDDEWSFDSFVPRDLLDGQPMTITIELRKPEDDRLVADRLQLSGAVVKARDHRIVVRLVAGERKKLQPLVDAGSHGPAARHAPIRAVDADRLVVWQLYWRGEQFWSGGEIWAELPDMKTTFQATTNTRFSKYLADRSLAPLGRRYFFLSEAGRLPSVKSLLPTARARDTFQVIDTTSNKFSLGAAYF